MSIKKALGRIGIILAVTATTAIGQTGNQPKSVKIGDLTWTAQNINIKTDGSWCYKNNESNCAKYGRLYTWEAAKAVCQSMDGSWRLPDTADWRKLVTYAGGYKYAGKKLKSKSGWGNNGNGTDDYGFSAMPSGVGYSDGNFDDAGNYGSWWSATEAGNGNVYYRGMGYHFDDVGEYTNLAEHGRAVRCSQGGASTNASINTNTNTNTSINASTNTNTVASADVGEFFTDSRDNKKYRSVKIGDHTWMAENLNYKTGKSWCYSDAESYCAKYGRLYDWKTAKSACPKGWHLPDTAEWNRLTAAVGGGPRVISEDYGDVYYEGVGKTLKSKTGWTDEHGNCNGTDDFGFSAMPGGFRGTDGGSYNVPMAGYFWSASEGKGGVAALRRSVYCRDDNLNENDAEVRHGYTKSHGYSVRCVQDYASPVRGTNANANASTITSAVTVAIRQITSADSVRIGKNTWINQNMNIETKGSWCFDDDKSYCAKYGRLYTYEAAKSVCTSLGSGWRLPTREDWNELVNYAGGTETAGQKLRAKSGWYKRENGTSGNGTDDYGFAAMPGGSYGDDHFVGAGFNALFWSATKGKNGYAYNRGVYYHIDEVLEDNYTKGYGYSVRCVKD